PSPPGRGVPRERRRRGLGFPGLRQGDIAGHTPLPPARGAQVKVHILDDWFDTLRTLPSFGKLEGHEVTVWNDHVEDTGTLAERLRDAEALVLFRERTAITASLLERLP